VASAITTGTPSARTWPSRRLCSFFSTTTTARPAARSRAAHRPAAPTARQSALIRDFRDAWQSSDIAALVALLDPDAVITADGGGQATAARQPIEGAEQISRYLAAITDHTPDLTVIERTVNGQPGLVAQRGGTTVTVLAFSIDGDRITRIWAIRNPDKLRAWIPGTSG